MLVTDLDAATDDAPAEALLDLCFQALVCRACRVFLSALPRPFTLPRAACDSGQIMAVGEGDLSTLKGELLRRALRVRASLSLALLCASRGPREGARPDPRLRSASLKSAYRLLDTLLSGDTYFGPALGFPDTVLCPQARLLQVRLRLPTLLAL